MSNTGALWVSVAAFGKFCYTRLHFLGRSLGAIMRQNFFSYGAFAQGRVHHSKFAQLIENTQRAHVVGEAYRLRSGYPVLSVQNQGHLIAGDLYTLNVTETFWAIIDELLGYNPSKPEKSFLVRQTVTAWDGQGLPVEAEIYVLNPIRAHHFDKKITNGDWLADLTQYPPLVEQLESRHKEYIAKLSKSRGRDIVPIKLDMYRELMSLQMIVDKGRRLALTQLGQETSYFV